MKFLYSFCPYPGNEYITLSQVYCRICILNDLLVSCFFYIQTLWPLLSARAILPFKTSLSLFHFLFLNPWWQLSPTGQSLNSTECSDLTHFCFSTWNARCRDWPLSVLDESPPWNTELLRSLCSVRPLHCSPPSSFWLPLSAHTISKDSHRKKSQWSLLLIVKSFTVLF